MVKDCVILRNSMMEAYLVLCLLSDAVEFFSFNLVCSFYNFYITVIS